MRAALSMLTAVALSLMVAMPTFACSVCRDSCCKDAFEGTYGYGVCMNSQACIGGSCACFNCSTSGSLCEGTAVRECNNPNGACEEHKGFLVVPHGDPLDFETLMHPPVLDWAELESCSTV